MSVVSVKAKDFILALFIRDDGERFLLGDNGFDFADSQMHFAANTIENDEVAKQGTDGVMVAGQVRRSSVQSFDGYIGDGTTPKETIEQMRRAFIAYFAKGHHFRVVYVDTARNAWQRKGGYLVDAPEVKELYQIHPEYHVGLNFEDVNYYSYDENADGDEILANLIDVPISSDVEGGLEWDSDGAISEDATIEIDGETATATGKNISVNDSVDAPISSFQLDGKTSQNGTPTPSAPVAVQTVTGENVVKICGKNLFDKDNYDSLNAYVNGTIITASANNEIVWIPCEPDTDYAVTAVGSNVSTNIYSAPNIPVAGGTANWLGTITAGDTTGVFTTKPDAKYIVVMIWTNTASQTLQEALDALQIELGNQATTYEAYQGQSYEVDLYEKDGYVPDTTASSNGVSVSYIDGTATVSRSSSSASNAFLRCDLDTPITVRKGEQFTIFANNPVAIGATESSSPYMSVRLNTGTSDDATTDVLLGTVNAHATFTATADITYTKMTIRVASSLSPSDFVLKPIVKNTPIELCGLGDDGAGGYLYQDYIWNDGGIWKIHKAINSVSVDGSAGGYNSTNNWYYYSLSTLPTPVSSGQIMSDYFAGSTRTYMQNNKTVNGLCAISSNTDIIFRNTAYSAAAGYKTWLGSTKPVFYYALATPTDTEITNATLIAQLEAILSQARTYAGTTNITTVIATGNEQGTLEVEYYTSYKQVITGGGYVWEDGGSGGATTIINNSISAVSPVWTVHGSVTNPTLENVTTGETIEYVGTIGAGQTLTVDMGEQTASLDGLNVIGNIVGDFISLAPGGNTLLYSATGDAPDSEIGWSEIVG